MALKISAKSFPPRGQWCYPVPSWVCSLQRGTHGRSLAVAAHASVPCFCHLTVYLGDDWESVHKECLTQVSFYGPRLLGDTEVITAGLISFRCCHLQHLSPERAGNLPKVTQQGLELLSLRSPQLLPPPTPTSRHPSAAQVTRREVGRRGASLIEMHCALRTSTWRDALQESRAVRCGGGCGLAPTWERERPGCFPAIRASPVMSSQGPR